MPNGGFKRYYNTFGNKRRSPIRFLLLNSEIHNNPKNSVENFIDKKSENKINFCKIALLIYLCAYKLIKKSYNRNKRAYG